MAGQPRSGCAINAAVEVIGDRWSLLVLRDIMFGNRLHFRVLQEQSEEGIASKHPRRSVAAPRRGGSAYAGGCRQGRRSTYSLTEAAIELVPVMAELGRWGAHHRPTTPTLRVRAELLADGGPAMWEDFMTELRAEHLGMHVPSRSGPTATERLASAYAALAADADH
ncbi:winged helix-turn-helix transcriptional regulator [Rhodococcus jostii]|uniref:winged helix-turn-helix transcriptional regulator n=1 Tax=Rhodococcus jostii TaxID=132919 RepID=UPI00362AE7C9